MANWKNCAYCKKVFDGHKPNQKYCSYLCYRKDVKRQMAELKKSSETKE